MTDRPQVIDLETANARLVAKREALGITPSTAKKLFRHDVMPNVRSWARTDEQCALCQRVLAVGEVESQWQAPRRYCRACSALVQERRWWRRASGLVGTLQAAGVDTEFCAATLTDFHRPIAAQGLRFGCAKESRGLFVTGDVGRGKTRLAVAVLRVAGLLGREVRYVSARALFRRIWETYRDKATETESAVIDDLTHVEMLAIDDLGPGREGRVTPAVVGALHEILSRRSGNFRPTIVTSNRSLAQIGNDYDPAIMSRLATFELVTLSGPDWRIA